MRTVSIAVIVATTEIGRGEAVVETLPSCRHAKVTASE